VIAPLCGCGHEIADHDDEACAKCSCCDPRPRCKRCGSDDDTVRATNYGRLTGGWQFRCCGGATWPGDLGPGWDRVASFYGRATTTSAAHRQQRTQERKP
jgi:hypothetical protein